jgi:Ca2+-binding EF-hand superfamily protein
MAALNLDDLKEAFYNFDYDRDGYLTIDELRHIVTNIGDPMPPNDVTTLLAFSA